MEGRWKGAGLGDYYCSVCGHEVSGSNRSEECPECGATMDDWEKDVDIEEIILSAFEEDI